MLVNVFMTTVCHHSWCKLHRDWMQVPYHDIALVSLDELRSSWPQTTPGDCNSTRVKSLPFILRTNSTLRHISLKKWTTMSPTSWPGPGSVDQGTTIYHIVTLTCHMEQFYLCLTTQCPWNMSSRSHWKSKALGDKAPLGRVILHST